MVMITENFKVQLVHHTAILYTALQICSDMCHALLSQWGVVVYHDARISQVEGHFGLCSAG